MAITTMDGMIAGLQVPQDFYKFGTTTATGRFASTFYWDGRPGKGLTPSSGTAGSALTTYAGQIPFTNPVTGSYSYLARFSGFSTQVGTIVLADRLWHNNAINVTFSTTQSISSVAWPARDINGSTAGEGIMIGVEITNTMGAGTPNWTMKYLNSVGNTQSTTVAVPAASMVVGSFIPIGLTAGDTGVKKIIEWSASATMTSGAYSLVAYRILTSIDVPIANAGQSSDVVSCGMPRLFDNTVPFILYFASTTTAPIISSQIIYTQG